MNHNPNAVPSDFILAQGTITTQNQFQPSVSIPYGNTVTRDIVTNTITQVVAPYQSISLSGSQQWQQSWNITPQPHACAIGVLHDAYLYVLGQLPGEDGTTDSSKYTACLKQIAGDQGTPTGDQNGHAAGRSQQDPTTTPAADAKAPAAGSGQNGPGTTNEDWQVIQDVCGKEKCFKIVKAAWCEKTSASPSPNYPVIWVNNAGKPHQDTLGHLWICLGRYGYSTLNMDETMISQDAYKSEVLFHLVLLTVGLQPRSK